MTNIDIHALATTTNTPANPSHSDHYVTVAALRAALNGLPDNAVVILAEDAEGNGFSPLSLPIGYAWYRPESTWAGELASIGPDADGDVYEPDGSELVAVVLDPVN